jgi:putative restriction endonuclease
MAKNNWSRNEHIVAFNLYCKIPFPKINANNKEVIALSAIIGRSAASVAMKLANFARLDPALKARNISGLSQGAKGEEEVWKEFSENWDNLSLESEQILARYLAKPIESSVGISTADLLTEGLDRETIVKIRVNQAFFRKSVLASYNFRCCVTGMNTSDLLVAGHIIPWSQSIEHRTNPGNGLCMNALFDKAFDKGLMTITPEYEIKFSDGLLDKKKTFNSESFFYPYHKKRIALPQKFLPIKECLEYHNQKIFIG